MIASLSRSETIETPVIGQIVIGPNGKQMEIISITERLSPFKRPGQSTELIGWLLGLREVSASVFIHVREVHE